MRMILYIKRLLRYIIKGPEVIIEQPKLDVNISLLESNNKLKGKKIIVTGGDKGIGYAMAKKFISEGANVIIVGRDVNLLKKVSQELKCEYIKADLQHIDCFEGMLKKADEILKGANCLVNNAGVSLHEGNIRNVKPSQFETQIGINLKAPYFLSQKFINIIESKNRKGCNILFVSSERGTYVDDIPYGITKNAINCFVRGLARRLIANDIRVNAVAPGITATDLIGKNERDNLYLESGMSKRIYLPSEIAEIACFLLSDISNCLNGQILTCDEGKSINAYWR